MITPMKSPGEIEEQTSHSDSKKSRNRHLVIINQLRKKEDTWDNRFYLQNIPEYKFNEDKHCETYKKILFKKKTRKFVLKKEIKGQTPNIGAVRNKFEEENGSEDHYKRPDTYGRPPVDVRLRGIHPNDMKSRQGGRGDSMRKHTPLTETLLKEKRIQEERLFTAWESQNIPIFHQEAFLKCENMQNLKQTIEIIKKEADEIEAHCSPIQLAIRAVTARENCLKQLKALIQKLETQNNHSTADAPTEPINEEELQQKASELLTHLRILSLNAVETILKWREYIQQTYYITRGVVKANQIIIIPFLHNEGNYLLKMKNDTKDLITTPLAKSFTFSSKSDPFLVYPSKETDKPGKTVLYISKSLINRIRACELVILEESVHEHINEKNAPASTPPLKAFESPSDRSLKNDDPSAQKRPSNIKIRNTSLVTSAKARKTTAPSSHAKAESTNKPTSASQPDSKNHLTESNADHKKENLETKHESTSAQKVEAKADQPKQESLPQQAPAQEKVPTEKVTPQKEAPLEHVEDVGPAENKEDVAITTSVQPVDHYEDEMEEYLKHYLGEIDQSMKNSFLSDPHVLLERANMGQDPMWFELVESSDVEKKVGLAVAHIDNTVFTTRRMVILHFTSADRERYQEFLGKFIEYIWQKDECNEIKISLYYLEDQNNHLGADKHLQDCIKKLGFRWKQLTNDKFTGKRYIDYIIKRPENVISSVINANDEPIHVKSVVVLSDLQGETGTKKTSKYTIDNRFAVLTAVLKHCDEKIEKLSAGETKRNRNYLQVIGSLMKEGEQAKIGDLTGKFQNLQEMEAFVAEKFKEKADLLPTIDPKYSTNIFTTSLLNLIYRWKSFNITHHKVDGKDRKYIKINNNGDLVQFQSKHKNSSIYFIPTDDNEVNVFLTDNDAVIKEILNQEEIMEDSVAKLFSKLERTPTPFQEDLWVPLFSLTENNIDLEDAKSLLQGEYKLNYATTSCQIGLNGSRVAGNLKVRPSEKSKIIEKPFLFGIVHEQVDFPLFAVVVQPEEFLQSDV